MNSICLFASYFTGQEIPYYITVYIKELKKHFGEVVFLTSQKNISKPGHEFLKKEQITLLTEENEGFDFGLWYHAFQKLNIEVYDQVALVNDSSVLFKPLDEFMHWQSNDKADVKGMTMSHAIYPHLQSYFLVLNKRAAELARNYFEQHRIKKDISEVIHTYEVGLSRYWQESGLTLSAFVDNNGYRGEFSPYYYCLEHHLLKGIPVIKKKIIFSSYRKPELFTLARMDFNIDPDYYLKELAGTKALIIDLDRLKHEKREMNGWDKFKYNSRRIFIRIFRPVYKKIKGD